MTGLVQLSLEQICPLQVQPVLRELQNRGPVHRVRTALGDEAWLVTGFEEVRRLLDDDRFGRTHPDPDNAARAGGSALVSGPLGDYETERCEHARRRLLMRRYLSPRHVRALTPRIEAIVTGLLDRLDEQDRPADLLQALARPLPSTVSADLFGVPPEDRIRFHEWADAAADQRDHARSAQGLTDLLAYSGQLVARRRREPGDDLISRLCTIEGAADEDIATAVMMLLFGHATTVMAIGLGALLLLTNPGPRKALRNDPDLIPAAVEEILRAMDKGGDGLLRYARADLEIAGTPVRRGDLVLFDTGAANHDAAVFPSPDDFDITRPPTANLAFGRGAHYCPGAALARLELRTVLSQLIIRFPGMRPAVPPEDLRVDRDQVAAGLTTLPVTW
jgi:cytochrome P450